MPAASDEAGLNAALICDLGDPGFVGPALAGLRNGAAVLVTGAPGLLAEGLPERRVTFGAFGLDIAPVELPLVLGQLRPFAMVERAPLLLVVDMAWAHGLAQGADSFDLWSRIAAEIAGEFGVTVVSLYDRQLLIEDQLQAALRAHPQFVAPSGIYDNPFWVPPRMLATAAPEEQLAFMLGRVVPDYAGLNLFDRTDGVAGRGADPGWIVQPRRVPLTRAPGSRWKIQCLGRLTVRLGDDRPVRWDIPGASPNKSRALFAYLLQSGTKGAHVDRIAELLWPTDGDEDTQRARLHHTVAMLRRTLDDRNAVLRNGEYYQLNIPPGSWIDIRAFEQCCRRAISLEQHDKLDEAMVLLAEAERLYAGDLFEDLPPKYLQSDLEDWCVPKRMWLREMAIKVQRDMSVVLRRQGRAREAFGHCQKALALDPTSEIAHSEALRVLHAQGRNDVIRRQYQQFCLAMESIGANPAASEVHTVFRSLVAAH